MSRNRSGSASADDDDESSGADVLRKETVGGALILLAAVVALAWANSRWSSAYISLRDTHLGPEQLRLRLTVGEWAADGLLALFFFVAGLELKREIVAGSLRDRRRAALPVAAAIGGMAVPALIYVTVNRNAGFSVLRGWAIPTATDIAFALAVLAVIGRRLPPAFRVFLLTLAVVDDLIAISIIAIFFTHDLSLAFLLLAFVPLTAFAVLVRREVTTWWMLLPLALVTWALVHASGVHATVAGVLLALSVPVSSKHRGLGLAQMLEHRLRPVSAGIGVPVFAFFSAGVGVGGFEGLRDSFRDTVTLGVVLALVVGKAVGVLGAAFVVARLTKAELDETLNWFDMTALSLLAGIGFTVSLLIGELTFGTGSAHDDHVKVGVLAASVLATLLAMGLLRMRRQPPMA